MTLRPLTGLWYSSPLLAPNPPLLSLGAVGTSTVGLSWVPGVVTEYPVASYRVYRNGALVDQVPNTQTTFTDTGLTSPTTFTYTVVTVDAEGSFSLPSNAVQATTTWGITSPSTLGNATVSLGYSYQFTEAGGTSPFIWVLQSQSGANSYSMTTGGLLTGTPQAPGTTNMVVQLFDSANPQHETQGPFTLTAVSSGGGLVAPGVTGSLTPGGTITIVSDGSNGFGNNGPNLILFDDGSTYGSVGSAVAQPGSTQPVVGNYDQTATPGNNICKVASGGRNSNGLCAAMSNVPGSGGYQGAGLRVQFNGSYNEVYVGRAQKFANPYANLTAAAAGGYYLGSNTATSFWKTVWALYESETSGYLDLVMPTFGQGISQGAAFAGNSGASPGYVSGNEWFYAPNSTYPNAGYLDFINQTWQQWESWVQINPTYGQPDQYQFRICNLAGNTAVYDTGTKTGVLSAGSSTKRVFTDIDLNSFIANLQTDPKLCMQDYYVSVGNTSTIGVGGGACSRVVIGNAPTWNAVTQFAYLTPTSWSNSSITGVIREGGFSTFSGAYLYVLNANNVPVAYQSYASGYGRPIT
jgi:chitodextrinase